MNSEVKKVFSLMSKLDQVGRNGKTGYEVDKIHSISSEAVKLFSSLDDLDDDLKKSSVNELNSVLELINKEPEKDYMQFVRLSTSPIISVLKFYDIDFY